MSVTCVPDAGDARTALVAITVARSNLALLATLWHAPGRPAWWTGEPRSTPPPGPAAKAQVLSEGLADMPDHVKAGIQRMAGRARERYLAREREAAEAKMRSYLPDQPGVLDE